MDFEVYAETTNRGKIMTAVLLIGWVVLIAVSYKVAIMILAKTNNL